MQAEDQDQCAAARVSILWLTGSIHTGAVRAYDVIRMLSRDGRPTPLGDALPGCPRAAGGRAGTARRSAESDDAAKAAVPRVLADRSYSA